MNARTILVAVLGILTLCGSAWALEGMVAHWKFDEGSGTTAYDSDGTNDGSIYGATWTTGRIDGALDFDGANDYVSIPHDQALNITGDITIAAWVFFRKGGSYQGIVTKCVDYGSRNTPFFFYVTHGALPNLSFVRADVSGHERVYSTVPMSLREWHHVLVRVENKVPDFYVNGVVTGKYADIIFTRTPRDNTKPVLIGRRDGERDGERDGGLHFDGLIDDVRIYERALFGEEIWELYRSWRCEPGYPCMKVWPATLEFFAEQGGSNPEYQIMAISNSGIGIVNWEVTEDCDWLEVIPNNGTSTGEVDDVNLSVDITNLSGGYYNCKLTISDPCVLNSPQTVNVNLFVQGPKFELSAVQFEFFNDNGYEDPNDQILTIRNDGGGILNWSIAYDCHWLSAEPNSGSSTGEVDEVALSVGITGLAFGTYDCNLTISDPCAGNSPQTVAIALHILAVEVHVPSQFSTIQDAIDFVREGDTVIVEPNTYTGDGNRDIDFGGKAIMVRSEDGPSNCIIDCNGTQAEPHRGFYFHNDEDANSILEGFTITGGYAEDGGGIYCDSGPVIRNCLIIGNDANNNGAGIHNDVNSSSAIINCTIVDNIADANGGGIYCENDNNSTVTNCIIWDNLPQQIDDPCSTALVTYSDVQGGWLDTGNIDTDPCFADPDNGDYHLKSEEGRWDPNSETWVTDSVTSPCIEAGNPYSDWSAEHCQIINMGAYGGTDQASKSSIAYCYCGPDFGEWVSLGFPDSWCCPTCQGDATGDGKITTDDAIKIADLIYKYGERGVIPYTDIEHYDGCADADQDGYIRGTDAVIIAGWLNTYGVYINHKLTVFCPHSLPLPVPPASTPTVTIGLEIDAGSTVGPGNTITINVVSHGSDECSGFEVGAIVEAASVDENGQAAAVANMSGRVNDDGGYPMTPGGITYLGGYLNNYQGCLFDLTAGSFSPAAPAETTLASFSYTIANDWDWREFYIAPLVEGTPYYYEEGSMSTARMACGYFEIDDVANNQAYLEGVSIGLDCFVDFNCDGIVNMIDFAILGAQWQQPPGEPSADVAPDGGDGIVDWFDLAALVDNWMAKEDWWLQLVSHWKFDEGEGTIAYDSVGNNDGTIYGATWTTGQVGGALDFDGVDDYVEVIDSDDSLDIYNNITLSAWVKLNDLSDFYFIVTKQPTGTSQTNYPGNYEFRTTPLDGYLQLYYQTGTADNEYSSYISTSAIGAGVWNHVSVTLVEGGNVNFYIDGSPAGTVPQSGIFGLINDEPVRIGTRKDGWSYFNGTIDDVRIYQRALSAEEVQQLYNNGSAGW